MVLSLVSLLLTLDAVTLTLTGVVDWLFRLEGSRVCHHEFLARRNIRP